MTNVIIDYDELATTCATLRDIYNSTTPNDQYQLPEFNDFTQEDVQYCFDRGWSHYVELATYLNPSLVSPDPSKTKIGKIVNGRTSSNDRSEFHYFYERLTPAQEVFFTSRLKLTWAQVQQIYKARFEPEPNHLGARINRTVKSLAEEYQVSQSTLARYLNREYIRRHAVPGSYDK